MKSLAELQAIKNRMKDRVVLRDGMEGTRVVVGMATCGIAAGARPVLNAFVEGVNIFRTSFTWSAVWTWRPGEQRFRDSDWLHRHLPV